jgi:hypothetical protein
MTIEIRCTHCEQSYRLADKLAGKKAKCKNCGGVINIPAAPASADSVGIAGDSAVENSGTVTSTNDAVAQMMEEDELSPAKNPKPASQQSGPGRTGETLAGPVRLTRRRRKRSLFPGLSLQVSWWGIVIAIVGIGLIINGYREYRLASLAKVDPQQLALSKLLAEGPGSNAHLMLKEVYVCDNMFVYAYNKEDERSTWTNVWVPILPEDGEYCQRLAGEYEALIAAGEFDADTGQLTDVGRQRLNQFPQPSDIQIILKTSKVKNMAQLESMATINSFQGILVNEIESLGSEEKKLLQESYPSADFSSCYIFEEDRKLTGSDGQLAYLFFGLCAVVGSLAIMVRRTD